MFAWLRYDRGVDSFAVVVCNLTPQTHFEYRLGVPRAGYYQERMNTDAIEYGGSGQGNLGGITADAEGRDGQPYSLRLTLPPLATLVFCFGGGGD